MTVFEILYQKYKTWLKNMTPREWRNLNEQAEHTNKHIVEIMFMALEITEFDIKANGGYKGELWQELHQMHQDKLIASNQHRQYHGKVDSYWLTQKGFKKYKDLLIE